MTNPEWRDPVTGFAKPARISTTIWYNLPSIKDPPASMGEIYTDFPFEKVLATTEKAAKLAASFDGAYFLKDGQEKCLHLADAEFFVTNFWFLLNGSYTWASEPEEEFDKGLGHEELGCSYPVSEYIQSQEGEEVLDDGEIEQMVAYTVQGDLDPRS